MQISRNVTERRTVDVALRDSELQYRRLFETARDGILILDASTLKIIDANGFMTELLGYSREEFLGRELWEIGFFGDQQASKAVYQELQESGYVRYDHLPLRSRYGKSAEVEFISNIYQVGTRSVAQCNIRDISERSRMELKVKEQATALASLNSRKDEFLAMLSHELRSPLAPISNAVRLLRLQKDEDPLQQRARAIIERQLNQLTRLVDDLMEVSRISTGKLQLRCEPIVVGAIVERALETTRTLIQERMHSIKVSLSPQPLWVYADAARLEQVIVNLISNAAKYTEVGGQISLTVEKEGDECVLRLRDSGIGISPELLPNIFELFTQAERSLDRSLGGLGIGLALVERLVHLHGGKVEVNSVLGQGSEFIVRLPGINPVEPASPIVAVPTETGAPCKRVLIVDDNVDAAESLAMLFRAVGHDVRTAHEGLAALRLVVEYQPHVALLDIGLPGMTGYEIAKWIRQQPGYQSIMLVAVTGYGQDSDRMLALAAGFDHHLVKPVEFDEFSRILATVSTTANL